MSFLLSEAANRETDRRRLKLNLLSGGKYCLNEENTPFHAPRPSITLRVYSCAQGTLNLTLLMHTIDREFVTSEKKFANFSEVSEIKKIRKNSYKNSLNARMGVAFQWNSLLI